MHSTDDSTRILRTAAWIWLGFLLAMALMDIALYMPQVQNLLGDSTRLQPALPNQPLPPTPIGNLPNSPLRGPHYPVFIFYTANGLTALFFLALTHWSDIQAKMEDIYYPFLLSVISVAPIVINAFIIPRFPQGPLSNAEGMALRQLPVMFVALVLVAWNYRFLHVVLFSIVTTFIELGLVAINPSDNRNITVYIFIAIIRTISFVAVGFFISFIVSRLRKQRESLREANANLTHYASTLEQLTVSRERNRLARELHDTLAHSLTAISVSLETAKAYFDIDLNQSREMIDTSLEATRKGVDETRRALKALRSSDLVDMGLRLAVKKAAESAASRFSLDLELDLQDPMPSLSPDVEQTILRVTQEAIENMTKHSQAKKFSVRLTSDKHTTLVIQDDGIGFDMKPKDSTGHFGLVGMRERAELAGGTLKIESGKGKGTKVVLTI
ncbi:MAG TPA: sensor histidine kinase [Anaerolineales bacterium]|nr:sensor histidine kinase [Anaerolineales bacterium]